MSSLSSCIKKAGKAINASDREELMALRQQITSEGITGQRANEQALDEYIEALQLERLGLLQEIDQAGGDTSGIARPQLYSRSQREIDLQERMRGNAEGRPPAPETEPVQPIPAHLSQEEKYQVARQLAEENREHMAPILERISWRLGIEMSDSIKSFDSAMGKANRMGIIFAKNRPWWNMEHLRDIYRFKAKVNDMREIETVLSMLDNELQSQGGIEIVKVDTGKMMDPGEWGWRFVAFDIRMPNGQIAEFYASPRELIETNSEQAHTIFERWRGRDAMALSAREWARWQRDIRASQQMYTNAMRDYLDRTGQDERAVLASLSNIEARAESITARNSSARKSRVISGTSEVQTPSGERNALNLGSATSTEESERLSKITPQSVPAYSRQPLYLRTPDEQRSVAARAAEIRLALAPAIRALVGKAQVNVAQTTEELPGDAVPGDVEGMWLRGTDEIWLVADNIGSIERAKRVMVHEAFGHLAMEDQPEFADILKAVQNLKTMGNAAIVDAAQHVLNTQGQLDATTEAKEIIAVMAERGVQSGTMARVFTAIRNMLRRMGLALDYTEAEIRELIVRAARGAQEEARAKRMALANMPENEQLLRDPRTVSHAVHAAINEVYAAQSLQDMTLMLHQELNAISTADPQGNQPELEERANLLRQVLYRQQIAPESSPDDIHPDALYSIAWHGSAADFEAFDLDYIGTGEGNQSYGWGLYFTSSRDIGEWYRGKLARAEWSYDGGEPLNRRDVEAALIADIIKGVQAPTTVEKAGRYMYQARDQQYLSITAGGIGRGVVAMFMRKADVAAEIENQIRLREKANKERLEMAADARKQGYRQMASEYEETTRREEVDVAIWRNAAKHWEKLSFLGAQGVLYKVNIPDGEHLMRFNWPLTEQHPAVEEILQKHFPELWETNWIDHSGGTYSEQEREDMRPLFQEGLTDEQNWNNLGIRRSIPADAMSGDQFYNGYLARLVQDRKRSKVLATLLPGFTRALEEIHVDKNVSLFLRELGILGHEFKGTSSGETNYVIYDDTHIEIIEKEGKGEEPLFSRAGTRLPGTSLLGTTDQVDGTELMVYDTHTGQLAGGPYKTIKGARRAVDRLDNQYGAYKYQARRVPRTSPLGVYSRAGDRSKWRGVGQVGGYHIFQRGPNDYVVTQGANGPIVPGRPGVDNWAPGRQAHSQQSGAWNHARELHASGDMFGGEAEAPARTPEQGPQEYVSPDQGDSGPQMDLFNRQKPLFARAVNADPAIEALIESKMATPLEDIRVKDRFRLAVSKLKGLNWLSVKQGIIDSAASVEALEKMLFGELLDASESAYKQVLATRNLGSVMAAVMHVGIPVYQDGVFKPRAGRDGLLKIFQPITHHADGNLLAQWELYAAAVRASRLIKDKNWDGTMKERLFTQDEIDKALELEVQYPIFKTVHGEWQKFNSQLLDLAIKQGVINGEEAKIWRRNDYVPFYRAMESVEYEGGQGPVAGGKGVANAQSGIKRLHGSEKPLGNIFENMVMNTAYLMDAIYRNTAMQRIVAMADGIAMERVPLDVKAEKFSADRIAAALLEAGLIQVPNWQPGMTKKAQLDAATQVVLGWSQSQRDQWVTIFKRVKPRGNDIVHVLQDGKPVYYRVDDPLLLRSIGSMGAQQWGGLMNMFRLAKRTLTGAVTIDPAFMAANFVRDTLSTWVVAAHGKAPPFLAAIKGAKAAWDQDPDTVALMMAGAGGGGFYDHNPTEVRKMLAKKMPKGNLNAFTNSILTPRGLWRFWQKVGNASEQANRVAKFRQVIRDGGSVAEAAYQARDVLNFTMSGDYEAMKFLVQTVPFLNARVQGLYRLYRGGKENPVGFAMKGLMITAATLALLARNMDNDEYEELPEWDKDTYWHFWINGEHFRLPKPFEVGALFATIPERSIRLARGDEDLELFYDRMTRMVLDTFAFNPVPQLAKPIVEQYANRNMFTGNPIIGLMHEGLQPEAQYDPWTSETMRLMADAMPDFAGEWLRSPKRLEAAVRGYFGAVGMYALSAADSVTRRAMGHPDRPARALQDYPVVSRFWRNPQPRTSKYSSELYDMLHEADALYKTLNAYRDQGRIEEYRDLYMDGADKLSTRKFLHGIAGQIREINKAMRAVQFNPTMPPEEKREKLDKLNAQKIKIMSQVAAVSDLY